MGWGGEEGGKADRSKKKVKERERERERKRERERETLQGAADIVDGLDIYVCRGE